jgi:hypothetical protein
MKNLQGGRLAFLANSPSLDETTYTLVLKPLADEVPAIVRLRRALKCLLRSYGLRCLSCVESRKETSEHD